MCGGTLNSAAAAASAAGEAAADSEEQFSYLQAQASTCQFFGCSVVLHVSQHGG